MTDIESIFISNYKLLFRIIYAIIGDVEDAKDILQAVFIQTCCQPYNNIEPEQMLPWILSVAKKASEDYKAKKSSIKPCRDKAIEPFYEMDFDEVSISNVFNDLMLIIPHDLREPLRMHFIDNIPIKKIASRRGISYSRLRYWKNVLIKALESLIK